MIARIAALLFLSGAGSLVLEVTWSRMLKLVFGSTTLAASTVLVAYMAGLGIGGLLGGRFAARVRRPLALYALFEGAIGVYALVVPFAVAGYGALHASLFGALAFWPAALVRFALVLVLLLLPTVAMGATLPVLVSAVVTEDGTFARRTGLLYGLNTLGAMTGTLLTTFVLFPALGLRWTNAAGAALDIAAGLGAYALSRSGRATAASPTSRAEQARPLRSSGVAASGIAILGAYGVVGFTSLVYEVSWTRALAMACGSSVHAFAAMLAAFLAGIALGSLAVRRWADRLPDATLAFGLGLIALGVAALGTLAGFRFVPGATLRLYTVLGAGSNGSLLGAGFAVSILAMIAPTLVLGALFPLAGRALDAAGREPGAAVGTLYFANTLGAAAGAFAAGFVLVPRFGLAVSMTAMVALDLAAGAVVLLAGRASPGGPSPGGASSAPTGFTRRFTRGVAVAACIVAGAVLVVQPGWDRDAMTRGGYYRPRNAVDVGVAPRPLPGLTPEEIVFYEDGVGSTISVHRGPGNLDLRTNGKPDASLADMKTQVLIAHVPALFGRPAHDRALVVGLASGASAGSLALHPFRQIDVVEIEPAAERASHFFDAFNNRPLARPGLNLVLDDGRSLLARSHAAYDVIVSEPSNPVITGVSNLFTREFFAAAHGALRPGGQLCQWVQLYGMDEAALRSIFAAITGEFPYVYGFLYAREYPDLILLARDRPLGPDDVPRWDALPAAVRADLQRVLVFSEADLLSLLRLLPEDTRALGAGGGPVNTDDAMFVELHAPWVGAGGAAEQKRLIASRTSSPLALLGGGLADPEALGELALSFVVQRDERAIARTLIDAAGARGGAAAALAADAMLAATATPPDPARAAALLDEAVARNPRSFAARFLRARLGFESGRLEAFRGALADAEAALAAVPGDWRALHLRLQLNNALGDAAGARADAEALLATPLAPLFPDLWADAALAAAGLHRWDDAVREMRVFLDHRPNAPAQWRVLAGWLESAGRTADARAALSNAELATRNLLLSAHANARREALFGSRERAKQMLQSILRRDPSYAAAKADLDAM